MRWGFGTGDALRRSRGAWLDAAGWGPRETPWRELHREAGMRLRAYGGGAGGPLLLIVPAPIKRAYVWDLAPGRSVVRAALRAGFVVGLVEWTEPEDEKSQGLGLDDYADRMIGVALDALATTHDAQDVILVGHSLGGTLAAIFAALHPARVRGLVLIETPLRFGPGAGALGSLARAVPLGPEAVRAAFDPVPGSMISALGIAADPVEFVALRWQDALASATDPEAAATHMRILRWTLDELPMPAPLFADVAGRLCRDDEFFRGTLTVAGRRLLPGMLRAPVLAVLDPRSALVPPRAVLPFLDRTGARWTVLWHEEASHGVGLRHLGALVGRDAHRQLWPGILRWASGIGEPRPTSESH